MTDLNEAEADRVDAECDSCSARLGRSEGCDDSRQSDPVCFPGEDEAGHVVIYSQYRQNYKTYCSHTEPRR
jgi:hypothetical protein